MTDTTLGHLTRPYVFPAPSAPSDMAAAVSKLVERLRLNLDRTMPYLEISCTSLKTGSRPNGSSWASFHIAAQLPWGKPVGLQIEMEGDYFNIIDLGAGVVGSGGPGLKQELIEACTTSIQSKLLEGLQRADDRLLPFADGISIRVKGMTHWVPVLQQFATSHPIANLLGQVKPVNGEVPILHFGSSGLWLQHLRPGFEKGAGGPAVYRHDVGTQNIAQKCVAMVSSIESPAGSLIPMAGPTFVAGLWRPGKLKLEHFVFLSVEAAPPFDEYSTSQPIFIGASDLLSFLDPNKASVRFYRPTLFQAHDWSLEKFAT